MIKVYTATITNRLSYICKFLLEEQLGCKYEIVTTLPAWREMEFVIFYGEGASPEGSFHVRPHGILTSTGITDVDIEVEEVAGTKVFFSSKKGDFPFDIFAASFYLLSRYEEYLPHEQDEYGRYGHTNSLAYKSQFLKKPLINIWVGLFATALKKHFPALVTKRQEFYFTPTYDIDIAYAYRGKSWMRTIGGFLKDRKTERFSVLNGKKRDPHDAYVFLDKLDKKYHLNPIYFFLVAHKNGKYDKHILPQNWEMQQLIKRIDKNNFVGLHPSWQSFSDPSLIAEEKKRLEKYIDEPVRKSRQHYIKMSLPETYRHLIAAKIKSDYSMGYGSVNGFRASIASSFLWYDISAEEATSLRIYPFCFMDANCFYEEKLTVEQAAESLEYYYQICYENHGNLNIIFHNNFLGTDPAFAGYQELFKAFLQRHFA